MSASPPASIEWSHAREAAPAAARCVSLPFTAPTLTSMRVRRAQQGGLEMLLSNPAGGRGVYIARWSTLRAFAAPSLHDILLAERIAARVAAGQKLSPAAIHEAALEVASQGHGGRRLARAAHDARDQQQLGLRRLRAHLLLEIARHHNLPGSHSALNDPWSTQPEEHTGWLSAAPALLAPKLQASPATIAEAVTALARLAWPIGIGPDASRARLPRLLALLGRQRSANEMVEAAMLDRHAAGQAALHQTRALLARPVALLAAWRDDPGALQSLLEQPEWLLDGWDRLCLLDPDAAEATSLLQMLLYAGDADKAARKTESEVAGPLVRCGAAAGFDLLTRNEGLRLRELRLHDPASADFDA